MSESNKFEILVVKIIDEDNEGYASGQYKVKTLFNVNKPFLEYTDVDKIDWVELVGINDRISTETPVIGGIYTVITLGRLTDVLDIVAYGQLELSEYRHYLIVDEWSYNTYVNGGNYSLCNSSGNVELKSPNQTLTFFHTLTNADKYNIDNSCKFEFTMWSPSVLNISVKFNLPNFYVDSVNVLKEKVASVVPESVTIDGRTYILKED
jgi:hypothetical protein